MLGLGDIAVPGLLQLGFKPQGRRRECGASVCDAFFVGGLFAAFLAKWDAVPQQNGFTSLLGGVLDMLRSTWQLVRARALSI